MLRDNTERLWKLAKECDCQKNDCSPRNHRLCPICNNLMLYGSHFTNPKTINSEYAWNIDLIIPKKDGGSSKIHNLRAVHIKCNTSKKNQDQSNEYNK